MASPPVLAFDAEGRPVKFDTWLDDLHLFLQLTAKEDISLYDHALGHATAPAATDDSTARSQWQTRDAHSRFAIRNSLPIDEREHFGQHKTAQALYTAVVAGYSSPASAALGRLSLPYLLPDLASFHTVADLITHLRTSEARFRAAMPDESGLRLPRAGAAAARAKGAREAKVTAGEAVVGVVATVGVVVGLVGLEAAVGVVAATAGAVAGAGAVVGAALDAAAAGEEAVEEVVAAMVVVEALAVARAYSTLRRPRSSFPDAIALPRWADLMKKNIDIFALDFDPILPAMYVMSISGEGAQYLRVPPDPGIRPGEATALGARLSATPGAGEAAALGAGASAPPVTESTEALHTFTLNSVLVTSSTVLPCPAVPSGTLSGLYLPSFSTNLVAGSALQDRGVHQFTPAYERMTHCTCARTSRHLATFTRQPGSDLYTLTTESPQVAASASASGQLSAPCSCCALAHKTVLWHHRLGHSSVQRLRAMHKRYLVSGLPRVLPHLPASPAPPCLPCVEGRQRAAPHSSSFPPTTAPLQTLHMDVWGPARICGQGQERYFLIVIDDYSRYTTVFPLRTKGEVPDVLIPWIRASRLQLSERFHSDFPVLRFHSDRGGEFSSDLLAAYCAEHGIHQSFTLPASPQQNGVAERRIGLVMEVTRTSLIHAAAPHFLWPFAVRYGAHQLNLWPRVSLPDTSLTLRWTGEVGDASRFRVWGSRAFVRDTSADKLSSRAVRCVFLGFVPDASGWQFYHPTSRRVLASQDVTFDESVPFYRLFPYRTAPFPPPPLFLAPGAAVVDPLPPQGATPSAVSQVDPVEPVEVAVDSRPARGAEPERAEPRVAETGGAEPGGAESGGTEPGGAESGGAEPGSTEPACAESGGVESGGAEPGSATPGGALSSQQLRERSGAPSVADPATGAADPGVGAAAGAADPGVGAAACAADPGVGAAAGAADKGFGATTGAADPGVGAATGAADPGVGGAGGAAGAAGGFGAVSAAAGGTSRPRPYFVPLLQQVLSQSPPPCPPPSVECPPPVQSQSQLPPASPLPCPSPNTGPTGGLTERRHPESRPVSPVSRPESPVRTTSTTCSTPREHPPPVPGTHRMSLRPSIASQRVPLPSRSESSLPALADPESDSLRAASPTVTRLLATAVTNSSFESAAAFGLVAELVDLGTTADDHSSGTTARCCSA
ncbi:unnamed protein product [Closterium sp. NIES-65]|nr:unnamed protein product [Closterium sp. NIES-65]